MAKTVTRAMLSEAVAEATGFARADVSQIGDRLIELIGEALMDGETVKLTGFGSLQVRSRAERVGRNPRTGTDCRCAPGPSGSAAIPAPAPNIASRRAIR
ncbi:MAG: HU family DNA-binding protein [Devosia sp.]|nr:HU family DNA-binding protein [Devosia sp.]